MKPNINLNPYLNNIPEEIKKFMESFYRKEDKEYLESGANIPDLDMDLNDLIEEDSEKFLNELVLAMKHYKKSILTELLKECEEAEHENIKGSDYVEGCKATTNRIIVHIQNKLLNND